MTGGRYFLDSNCARDTSYRSSNLDTHLTHGCMPDFREFLRVRSGYAGKIAFRNPLKPQFFESARRTLMGAAL
jgi:hypothetical protein